jgi:hypothetical protein
MGPRSAAWLRRRARLAVFSMMAILALLHILLSIQLDSQWHDVRNSRTGAEYLRKSEALHRHIAENGAQPTVLVFGSSRLNMGVRAELLEVSSGAGRPCRAFNFGLFGSEAIPTCLSAQQLLESGIRPELVVLEVFPPDLYGPTPGGDVGKNAPWLPAHMRFVDLPRLCRYHSQPCQALCQWGKSRTLLAMAGNTLLWQKVAPGWVKATEPPLHVTWEMDRCGWVRMPSSYFLDSDRRAVYSEAMLNNMMVHQMPEAFHDYRIGEGVSRAMHDLLATCRKRGIRVVLLVPPGTSYLSAVYRKASNPNGESMEEIFQRFARELVAANECAVIDARGWIPDTGFFDAYHLTHEGAEQFTIRLRGELTPLLASK